MAEEVEDERDNEDDKKGNDNENEESNLSLRASIVEIQLGIASIMPRLDRQDEMLTNLFRQIFPDEDSSDNGGGKGELIL